MTKHGQVFVMTRFGSRDNKSKQYRKLSDLSKLDRSDGGKHEHYGWRDVAAANHAQEGQEHK